MSETEPPPPTAGKAPHSYWSPKASRVSAVIARWPDQPFSLDDVVTIGYAEEAAQLAGLEDAQRRKETNALKWKAAGLMARTTIQRYVEGDGFYLQEGKISQVYETAAHAPSLPQVWRATPMEHPAPAGPQTTDDWLIIWNAHKPMRSSPLLRESLPASRVRPLAELFVREASRTLTVHEVTELLYPNTVAETLNTARNDSAGRRRVDQLAQGVRHALHHPEASRLLSARLAEQGLRLLQGQVVGKLADYDKHLEAFVRVFFRAAPLTEAIPEEPALYGNIMVRWRELRHDDPKD